MIISDIIFVERSAFALRNFLRLHLSFPFPHRIFVALLKVETETQTHRIICFCLLLLVLDKGVIDERIRKYGICRNNPEMYGL